MDRTDISIETVESYVNYKACSGRICLILNIKAKSVKHSLFINDI